MSFLQHHNKKYLIEHNQLDSKIAGSLKLKEISTLITSISSTKN